MVPVGNKEHLTFDGFLTQDECEHIAHILTRDEHKILRIPNNTITGYTGTTSQYSVYNLLTHGDIRPLNIPDRIFDLPIFQPTPEHWYSDLWVQCWGNVLHQGQELTMHMHSSEDQDQPMCACSIYIQGSEPSYTHWEDTGQTQNVVGQLNLVGQHHLHQVKPQISLTPRISIAFDIHWEHSQEFTEQPIRFLHIRRDTRGSHDYIRRHTITPEIGENTP